MVPDSGVSFPNPDTTTFNDTIRYSFSIVNNTAVDFNDSIFINLRTPVGGPFIIAEFGLTLIPAFGSTSLTFLDSTLSARYGGGVSIVVVWPTSPSHMNVDSIKDTLYIQIAEVIDGEAAEFDLVAFPNPTTNTVALSGGGHIAPVRETLVTDALGRVILRQSGLPGQIDFSGYAAGLYYLKVTLTTGATAVYRILRE